MFTSESHNLVKEFPEYKERIRDLKLGDRHFSKLFDEYHEVDQHLHRIELEIETPADEVVEGLKMQRLHLKDELYHMLNV